MSVAKTVNVEFLRPYSHKITWTPSTVSGTIAGAVDNVAGYAIGKHEVVVQGIDADETQLIENALDMGVYIKFASHTQAYRIVHLTKTVDVVTKIWLFPSLVAAVADDEVISTNPEIDLGLIGEDGIKIKGNITVDELKDEMGNTVEIIQRVDDATAEMKSISMIYENYLLIHPLSFFIIKDSAVAYQYGFKKGFVNCPTGKFVIVDKNNTSVKSKTVTFTEALLMTDSFEYGLGKEMMKGFPIKIKSTGTNLVTIGDVTAAYV